MGVYRKLIYTFFKREIKGHTKSYSKANVPKLYGLLWVRITLNKLSGDQSQDFLIYNTSVVIVDEQIIGSNFN